MKPVNYFLLTSIALLTLCNISSVDAQETPSIEDWSDKTVLFIGAHPDDDSYVYGTMGKLQSQGNDVHVMIMTTGNVGTKDPDMTREKLAKIRRQEELNALSILGIPENHYINLGYNDGELEFADQEEVVKQIVFHIRRLKPDVMIAFDPGYGYLRWRKADHRAASYLAVDAARAAEWRLMFPGHITQDGMEAHLIEEYLFFDNVKEDANLVVDISNHKEDKIEATAQHVSQFSAAWSDYHGPKPEDLPQSEQDSLYGRIRDRIKYEGEKAVEYLRYYKGIPDGIGKRH